MHARTLITGGAGFIGFHLASELCKRKHFVVALDNFNAYYNPNLKRLRSDLLAERGVETIEGDIRDRDLLRTLVEKHKITHITHLAAQAGVRNSIEQPDVYIQSNLVGFYEILEVCRLYPHLKLTYASSSSVYGQTDRVPFSENQMTDTPVSLYGATKKCNEVLAYAYHHLYQIKMAGLRYFTVYGPYGRPDMAYYSFTRSILQGDPLPLFKSGALFRDFTYIDDIVEGTIQAMLYKGGYDLFNLGNHNPIQITDFVKTLESLLGKKGNLIAKPMQKGDVTQTFANTEKAHKALGYTPQIPLREGLEQFVQWYLKQPPQFR